MDGPLSNFYKKEIFKSEIKPIIKNLQDELYQLENKQAKGAKFCLNIKWHLEGDKCSKTFFKVLERLFPTSKAATTKFLSKIPNRKKLSNDQFNLYEAKVFLDEIIKSINSQTNNKSSGNDALTI